MKLPRFSRWVTIPVLFILNFLAWLYIYDDYMMNWVIIYPLFMVIATAFTITAEMAFGKDRKFKYIGINICIVLLLLVLTQKYLPMEKIEAGLKNNYYGHIKADVTNLNVTDKAVRNNGLTIVARNFFENQELQLNDVERLEVYKNGKLIDEVTLEEAINKIQELIPSEKKGQYKNIFFHEVRYVGLKRKSGIISLKFTKGYVDFIYSLAADENGFIWEPARYKLGGLLLPRKDNLYGSETNEKIKDILIKGDREQVITVEIMVKGNQEGVIVDLKNLGYEVINSNPVTVKIPFYEIANLAHEEYIEKFEIK